MCIRDSLETVAQQIGGVYINKIASNQDDFVSLEPVPYEKQKQAFELLKNEVFSNGAMSYDPKILANLIFERDSDSYYANFGDNNDPDFHEIVLASQSNILRNCLLYTSPSPRDRTRSRMPSSA